MRTITRLFSLLAAIILPVALWANVIVKGTVKYTNGQPATNYEVIIESDSIPTPPNPTCLIRHVKRTNANGFYHDTLVCSTPITRVIVWVKNCDGTIIRHLHQVPASGIVESNFVVCINAGCRAHFGWSRLTATPLTIAFTDSSSAGSNTDSILSRKWSFGDGTYDSTQVNPTHTYAQTGGYNVCLRIKTRNGCVSEICKFVQAGNYECHPEFNFEPVPGTVNLIRFNSAPSTISPTDSIINRKWTFGDGTSLNGNVIAPLHQYNNPGAYSVCLTIKTKLGCEKIVCKPIVFGQLNCHANFLHEVLAPTPNTSGRAVKFRSQTSTTGPLDSIVNRKWKFGDGTNLDGNVIEPVHVYQQPGAYMVCLYITSARGCKDSVCKPVVVPPHTFRCQPKFTHFATGLSVKLNSAPSMLAPGDSITNRFWTFGDGTSGGNLAEINHVYARAGEYEVCLRIQTRSGCMETWCKKVAVVNVAGNCVPYFTAEQIPGAVRTIRFNSIASYSQLPGDSIVERLWTFGNGATLGGNVINPTHQYNIRGAYTVCLKLKTRLGCETRWCREIMVQGLDSNNTGEAVKIVSLYPVPVTTLLNAVIWSKYNNVNSTLAIYDIYGVKKWSQNKLLSIGNSTHLVPVSQLANGPYIFRVTTIYGVTSRNFYKVQ